MPFRSTLPDLVIPEDVDFSSFVLARGRQTTAKTALIDVETGVRISYGALIAAIDAGAERLRAHGLQRGDMVAICDFNTPSFAVAAHAVWRAGAVVVTMNPLFTVREMHQELVDAGARYVIAASEVLERVGEAARLAGVSEVASLGEPDSLTALDALTPRPPPLRGANIGCADVPTAGEGETTGESRAGSPLPVRGRGAGGEGTPW
jgi:acyl-CoA synthetase (AMP-forming)/AMP-acid ligase II